jgi:hypothetical protein
MFSYPEEMEGRAADDASGDAEDRYASAPTGVRRKHEEPWSSGGDGSMRSPRRVVAS